MLSNLLSKNRLFKNRSRGLGMYLAIPTALALTFGLWFGLQLRESPEEQVLNERLDALSAQTDIVTESFLSEIDRIKVEVQNKMSLNSQIRFWTALHRQGNELGGVQASSPVPKTYSPNHIQTLKNQQWQIGKKIDIASIDQNGFQVFSFDNVDQALAWSNSNVVYVAWVSSFKSLRLEDRKTYLFHQTQETATHWALETARQQVFKNDQRSGIAYDVRKDRSTAFASFARLQKTPWILMVEQMDYSGAFQAPVPVQVRLGQGLALMGILLLFGGLAAKGLESKAKTQIFTAENPPSTQSLPKMILMPKENIKIEPAIVVAAQAAATPPPAPSAALLSAAQEVKNETEETFEVPALELMPRTVHPAADGATTAGPVTFKTTITVPSKEKLVEASEFNDESSGRSFLNDVEKQISKIGDSKIIFERVTAAISKLCDSPVLFFEYRHEFKASLLATTAGFAKNKTPSAMSFPIADEIVNTISQSVQNRKTASLSGFQPLCRVILDRTGVAHFDAWAVTSKSGQFYGVMVILQAGVQSAIHKASLTRLLSGIGLSSSNEAQKSFNTGPRSSLYTTETPSA